MMGKSREIKQMKNKSCQKETKESFRKRVDLLLRFSKLKVLMHWTQKSVPRKCIHAQTISIKAQRERERERERFNYLEGLLHRLDGYPISCSKAAFEALLWFSKQFSFWCGAGVVFKKLSSSPDPSDRGLQQIQIKTIICIRIKTIFSWKP